MFSEKQKDAILDCLVKNHPDWLKEIQNTLDQKELLHEEKKSKQDFVKKLPVWQRSLYDLIHCAKIEIDDYVLYRCSAHSDSAGWDNDKVKDIFGGECKDLIVPKCLYGQIQVTFEKCRDTLYSGRADYDSSNDLDNVYEMSMTVEDLSQYQKPNKKRKKTLIKISEKEYAKVLNFFDIIPDNWQHYDGDRDSETLRCERYAECTIFLQTEMKEGIEWIEKNQPNLL